MNSGSINEYSHNTFFMFIQTEDKSEIRFSCPEFGSTKGNLFKSLGCLFTVGFKQSNK